MIEPKIYQIKRDYGVPDEANFFGWLIHNPIKDDFLLNYIISNDINHIIAWCISPNDSKSFKTLKKAMKVLNQLDLSDRAHVVPAFDSGNQIIVISETVDNSLATKNALLQSSTRVS